MPPLAAHFSDIVKHVLLHLDDASTEASLSPAGFGGTDHVSRAPLSPSGAVSHQVCAVSPRSRIWRRLRLLRSRNPSRLAMTFLRRGLLQPQTLSDGPRLCCILSYLCEQLGTTLAWFRTPHSLAVNGRPKLSLRVCFSPPVKAAACRKMTLLPESSAR